MSQSAKEHERECHKRKALSYVHHDVIDNAKILTIVTKTHQIDERYSYRISKVNPLQNKDNAEFSL